MHPFKYAKYYLYSGNDLKKKPALIIMAIYFI